MTATVDHPAFLADVVIVLASRPGRVHARIRNPLPRPRDAPMRVSDAFAAAKRELWSHLQSARAAPTATPGRG